MPEAFAPRTERSLARALPERLLSNNPARYQLILGPRRVGKTTVLYQTVRSLIARGVEPQHIWWFRFDHPLLMKIRPDDLIRFAVTLCNATPDKPVFIFADELVYAENWDLWLKTFYDDRWPIRLAGSSSATAALRGRVTESGVGRWEEQHLTPYLFNEYLNLTGKQLPECSGSTIAESMEAFARRRPSISDWQESREKFMFTGGFPELLVSLQSAPDDLPNRLLESQRTLRNDAIERAIYKDIPQAFNIDHPQTLERLLYTLAEQVAGLVSPTNLCSTIDRLTQPTLDRYINYLERSFLIFLLQNYSPTEASRQRRGRKVYFYDCAVRNAALQRGLAPLSDMRERGVLYENLAASHLFALGLQDGTPVYHWRDKKHEVDLIYDHPEQPLAFEIAASDSHSRAGFKEFQSQYPRFAGRCYIVAPNAQPLLATEDRSGVGHMPLDAFLWITGVFAERAMRARLAVGTPSKT